MQSLSKPLPLLGCAFCALAAMLGHLSGILEEVDRKIMDVEFAMVRAHFPQPVATDIVIIGIDEAFLRTADEPVALLHAHLAALFEALAAAKPRLVGLDIVFPEKSFAFLAPVDKPDFDFDVVLTRGLLRLGAVAPIVIGKTWDRSKGQFREIHSAFVAASGEWMSHRAPSRFDNRGSSLVCPDPNGVVRAYPGRACQPDGSAHTLASRMAQLLGRSGNWQGLINYGIGPAFSYIPAAEMIARTQQPERLVALRDKVVLIGAVLDFDDRVTLPVALADWEPGNTTTPGMLLQAQILRSLLNQGLVEPAPVALTILLIAIGGLFFLGDRISVKLALFVVFFAATLALSIWLLHSGQFLPPASALAGGVLAIAVSTALSAWRYRIERQYLKQTFAGYVSPEVLKGILAGAISPGKAGEKKKLCVLFSDIRNFTTLSENMPADVVVSLLNRYFDRMADIVHQHGGTVDKFIGDGMMALFGAPQALASPEQNAMDAAQGMLRALVHLNRNFQQEGLPELAIGIGIHSGDAVIGHVGSTERHEYTAIGDAVNVAARIAGLPKTIDFPIACSEAVMEALARPQYLVDVGMRELKGHTALRIFGCKPDPGG